MVELDADDFGNIMDWFALAYGKLDPKKIPVPSKRTFWKITFLVEDFIKENKEEV